MKKLFVTLMILFAVLVGYAQTTTLTFVGEDRTGQDYVRLDRISIFNETQLWHKVQYYPDTLLMMNAVGIDDYEKTDFQLLQNIPNPFDGVTDFALTLPDMQDVMLEIFDINGKKMVSKQFSSLEAGTHQFRATLASPQTYLLSAGTRNGITTIKMVNTGHGGDNAITYMGMTTGSITVELKDSKSHAGYPFNRGDLMKYVGYATIDGTERASFPIEKNQNVNDIIHLQFDVARPSIITHSSTNVSAFAATLNGEVSADNNALVTERGFCYGMNSYPTIDDNTILSGSGTGEFSAAVGSLQPGKTYWVRAYATNAIGLTYGSNVSFTTNDTLPVVTTTQPDNITATSFRTGGNVIIAHCVGDVINARGVCWNTTGNPSLADSHTIDGSGLGNFISNITGLEPATIYYVRAYATNTYGTDYGEELAVTTLCDKPIVTTMNISNVSSRTANGGGTVTNEHGSPVTARGICWRTSHNPTISNAHTTDGTGMGTFSSLMDSLNPSTTYYVRAYATNAIGTAYGAEVSLTTLCDVPFLTTTPASNVTTTAFRTGGRVLSSNCTGSSVSSRGVCWNTTGNPTLADNNLTSGSGLGNFISNITGLNCSTTYYVRAYATNSMGTAYGEEISVTTLPPTTPEVHTVSANMSNTSNTIIVNANVLSDNCAEITARGVCFGTGPNPTIDSGHTTQGDSLGSFTANINVDLLNTTYYVRSYATNSVGTAYGEEMTVTSHNIPTLTTKNITNISYISATCGGIISANGGQTVTARGVCWSTSPNPTLADSMTTNGSGNGSFTSSMTGLQAGTTYYVRAYATNSVGTAYGEQKQFSTLAYTIPTVTTSAATNITYNSATSGGNVTADGGATVTARGVCWSTSPNPTISNSHTTNGTGTGSFTSSMTGLQAGTTYYVRAYATNSVGTAYGAQQSFTTTPAPFNCGTATVSDYDGNTYNTVQIGNQCWMKQNLRTTHYADGTSISLGSSTSTTTAYRYYPNNSGSNVSTYGYLYNWKAVMRNSSSSSSNPSGVQGICPNGWHVPSNAEWTQLINYVKSQSQYVCGSTSTNIAKALASTTGWNSSTYTCAVGNNPSTNNATGFSAVPAGNYFGGYYNFGYYAVFWSSTESGSLDACNRYLYYDDARVNSNYSDIYYGFSVRCLRD